MGSRQRRSIPRLCSVLRRRTEESKLSDLELASSLYDCNFTFCNDMTFLAHKHKFRNRGWCPARSCSATRSSYPIQRSSRKSRKARHLAHTDRNRTCSWERQSYASFNRCASLHLFAWSYTCTGRKSSRLVGSAPVHPTVMF